MRCWIEPAGKSAPACDLLPSFCDGVRSLGWTPSTDLEGADFAVFWGLRGKADLLQACQDRLIPAVILDLAHVKREAGYFRVALNRLNWLPPFPCPEARALEMGLKPAERKRGGGYALVCGQVPWDAAHGVSVDGLETFFNEVIFLAKHQGYRVRWRPHPRGLEVTPFGQHENSDPRETSLAEDLEGAAICITLNSCAGLEAILAGIPVLCRPTAVYSEIANPDIGKGLKTPLMPYSRGFFARLAYTQWTLEEIAQGQPLRFFSAYFNPFKIKQKGRKK